MEYSIKDLVKDNKVRFTYYRKGELWYEVIKPCYRTDDNREESWEEIYKWEPIFTFPVPIDDTGEGQFNAEDKAILFMRYIRKELEARNK